MTLKDMIDYAVSKANLGTPGKIANEVRAYAKMALNRQAELIWNRWDWLNSKIINLAVTTSEPIIVFPAYVDFIVAARRGGEPVEAKDPVLMNFQYPLDFESFGEVLGFVNLPHSAVITQPSTAANLELRSENGEDTGIVRISGVNEFGSLQWEELPLHGMNAAVTRNRFTEIRGISKEATQGAVRLLEGETVLAELGARDSVAAYRRIALTPSPEKETTITFLAKRKFVRMDSDYDVFPVYEAEAALVDGLVGELYEYNGKGEMALQARKDQDYKLQALVATLTQQAARESRVIPKHPMYAEVGLYGGF